VLAQAVFWAKIDRSRCRDRFPNRKSGTRRQVADSFPLMASSWAPLFFLALCNPYIAIFRSSRTRSDDCGYRQYRRHDH
jgi:hypothetical protein